MSPTVFRYKGYRFFFFSREESRQHVHVSCGDGEVKFWLQPEVVVAENYGLNSSQVNEIAKIIEEHRDELIQTWRQRFRN